LAIVGLPQVINNQFTVSKNSKTTKQEVLAGYIQPGSPASKIGLKSEDNIIGIVNSEGRLIRVNNANELPNITKDNAGERIIINYESSGGMYNKTVTLRSAASVAASLKTDNPEGYLGVEPSNYIIKRYTWSSPVVAVGFMGQYTVLTAKALGSAFMGLIQGNTTKASSQVSGPVGIVVLLKDGSLLGYQFILLIVAVISLSLGLINILPIPALDGGRLFFTILPRLVLKRPLKQRTEEWIHGSGMALLIVLFILITIVDIRRYF
jgi:regulator of sigma E protease